jgi:hypothetical protein
MEFKKMTDEQVVTGFAGSFMAPLELAREAYRAELLRRLAGAQPLAVEEIAREISEYVNSVFTACGKLITVAEIVTVLRRHGAKDAPKDEPESEPNNERLRELAERLVSPGSFPNMSASEGHELYEGIQELLDEAESYKETA